MNLYIGIDLGTSAMKLLLMDEGGNIKNVVSKEYPLEFPQPGWSQQNPQDWKEAVFAGIPELLEGFDAASVAGIGCGGFMEYYVQRRGNEAVFAYSVMSGCLAGIVILTLLIGILVFVYLRYTKHGYEIAVVGESERTARYLGIKVTKVILRTAALSGALCGLTGLLLVAGTNHTITTSLAAGRGFTAVMVSWMSRFDPAVMVLISFFLTFLERGSGEIATVLGLNTSFSDILTGIIIFFLIGSEFFVNYRLVRTDRTKEKEASHV